MSLSTMANRVVPSANNLILSNMPTAISLIKNKNLHAKIFMYMYIIF